MPQEPRYLERNVPKIHHLNTSEHTIEVARVDIKPAYCSSRPQFNDRPVATALGFLYSSALKKPLPVTVGIVSTSFPAIKKSTVGTELPFQALGRLCETGEMGKRRIARGCYLCEQKVECLCEKFVGYGQDCTAKRGAGQL
jgi:hypothetical protein